MVLDLQTATELELVNPKLMLSADDDIDEDEDETDEDDLDEDLLDDEDGDSEDEEI